MTTSKILAFAGSTRTESYNKKLARIAAAHARKAGGEALAAGDGLAVSDEKALSIRADDDAEVMLFDLA